MFFLTDTRLPESEGFYPRTLRGRGVQFHSYIVELFLVSYELLSAAFWKNGITTPKSLMMCYDLNLNSLFTNLGN